VPVLGAVGAREDAPAARVDGVEPLRRAGIERERRVEATEVAARVDGVPPPPAIGALEDPEAAHGCIHPLPVVRVDDQRGHLPVSPVAPVAAQDGVQHAPAATAVQAPDHAAVRAGVQRLRVSRVDCYRRHGPARQAAVRPPPAPASVGADQKPAPGRRVDPGRMRRVEPEPGEAGCTEPAVDGAPRATAVGAPEQPVLRPVGPHDGEDGRRIGGADRDALRCEPQRVPALPAVGALEQLLAELRPTVDPPAPGRVDRARRARVDRERRDSQPEDLLEPGSDAEAGTLPATRGVPARVDPHCRPEVDDVRVARRHRDDVQGAAVRSVRRRPAAGRGCGRSRTARRAELGRPRAHRAASNVVEAEVDTADGESDQQHGRTRPPAPPARATASLLDQGLDQRFQLGAVDRLAGVRWARRCVHSHTPAS
jgi:hypothetical protein